MNLLEHWSYISHYMNTSMHAQGQSDLISECEILLLGLKC